MYLHSRDTEAVLLMTDIFCLLVQCFIYQERLIVFTWRIRLIVG